MTKNKKSKILNKPVQPKEESFYITETETLYNNSYDIKTLVEKGFVKLGFIYTDYESYEVCVKKEPVFDAVSYNKALTDYEDKMNKYEEWLASSDGVAWLSAKKEAEEKKKAMDIKQKEERLKILKKEMDKLSKELQKGAV